MWFFEKSETGLSLYYSFLGGASLVVCLSMVFVGMAMVVSQKWRTEMGKLASFECGFDPMSSSRIPFSLRFFLLALLFLVFDIEMVLLFPYVLSVLCTCATMSASVKVGAFVFLVVLGGGLVHELNEGTLDWEMD